MNLVSLLTASSLRAPARNAWVQGTRSATYAQLRERVSRLAAGLRALGVQRGDRVLIVLRNGPELLELLWASFYCGAVAVPVNRHLHAREIAYVAEHSAARAIFLDETTLPAAALLPRQDGVVDVATARYAALLEGPSMDAADCAPDEPAWLFYTSGTTGKPKGATLTHRNLMAMTLGYYADIDALQQPAVFLHAAPLSHGSGLYLLPAVGRAVTNVLTSGHHFDAAEFLEQVHTHAVTHAVFLAPTMLRRLTDVALERAWTSPTLRSVMVGGAPLYQQDLEDARRAFGPIIGQMYGQGESPMTIAVMSASQLTQRDAPDSNWRSCGRPFTSVEVKVVGPDGLALGAGSEGEILVRGDVVMRGYWMDEGATAAALQGGWLRTGDVGHFDARGFLYLTDRSKDLIITGGSNVYPREVEEALLTHPGVHEVAVVGYPDPQWGESIRAYVVRSPAAQPDAAELTAHCQAQLASFKKPRSVVFLDELPKSANGKILKRVLRARSEPS